MDEFELRYRIKTGDVVIAAFLNEGDRNYCIDELAEIFDDCKFNAVEIE